MSPTDPTAPRPGQDATRAASPTPVLVTLAARTAASVLAVVTLTVLVAVVGAVPAGAVPSTVLPAPTAEGGQVTLDPPVIRAPDGHAELDVVLGVRAPGDVVVELSAAVPVVTDDGTVTPGARAEGVELTDGARLRPGERLRVRVTTAGDPVVVVARVTAATTTATGGADAATDADAADSETGADAADSETGADGADDADGGGPVELAALVLPDTAGPAPAVAIEVVGGQLRGTVTAERPLLVSARLSGARTTTHPDRLVLPGRPVVLKGVAPARWPAPSVLIVTDEAGRTVTVDTGRTALVVIATVLLSTAVLAAVVALRRRRSHVA